VISGCSLRHTSVADYLVRIGLVDTQASILEFFDSSFYWSVFHVHNAALTRGTLLAGPEAMRASDIGSNGLVSAFTVELHNRIERRRIQTAVNRLLSLRSFCSY